MRKVIFVISILLAVPFFDNMASADILHCTETDCHSECGRYLWCSSNLITGFNCRKDSCSWYGGGYGQECAILSAEQNKAPMRPWHNGGKINVGERCLCGHWPGIGLPRRVDVPFP